MKKTFITIALLICMCSITACTLPINTQKEAPPELTPEDFTPNFYLSEDELPEDAYYIAHDVTEYKTDKDGNQEEIHYTQYFPLLQAEVTYDEKRESYAGYDFNRVVWVNYSKDEGLIPTMYKDDRLIYKSSTFIPTKYALEKFFDNGYTLGVCGLVQDLSENYRYYSSEDNGMGRVLSTSDAAGFDGLEADSVYLVQVGDKRVTPANVSMSGTVTGLNLMEAYDCDIRTGTERILANLKCNVHYFSSAETYMFGAFTFITPIIAQLNIPKYVSNGYYEINGGGLFRFAGNDASITDWHQFNADLCNSTIYIYDEEGRVAGTTIGLVFDENGFLREETAVDNVNTSRVHGDTQTYEELLEVLTNGITVTKETILEQDNGYYFDNYKIDVITEKTVSGAYTVYEFTASSDNETLDFYYKAHSSDEVPVVGNKYQIAFKEPTVGSIKSYVVKAFTASREE